MINDTSSRAFQLEVGWWRTLNVGSGDGVSILGLLRAGSGFTFFFVDPLTWECWELASKPNPTNVVSKACLLTSPHSTGDTHVRFTKLIHRNGLPLASYTHSSMYVPLQSSWSSSVFHQLSCWQAPTGAKLINLLEYHQEPTWRSSSMALEVS